MSINPDDGPQVYGTYLAITGTIRSQFERDMKRFQAPMREIADRILEENAKRFRDVVKGFGQMMGEHQKLLWSRGWMIDMNCPLVAISKGAEREDGTWDGDQVDQWMLQYFKEKTAEHQKWILEEWPDRSDAFQEIFDLALQGRYRGAIAALLPLIDYVSKQRTGAKFFNHTEIKGGKKVSMAYKALVEKANMARILEVLCEYSPVYCKQKDGRKGIVNRHDVLHGDDDTYGTEMNYFRCFSITIFLTTFAKADE